MINIDEIEEICDTMIEEGMDYCPAGCGTAANVKELIIRLRQAEKDAARYRWLRDLANKSVIIGPAVAMVGRDGSVMMREHGVEFLVCSDELDAAMDEAMQCNK